MSDLEQTTTDLAAAKKDSDVNAFLTTIGLTEFQGQFAQNRITYETLPELSDSDLTQLGMTALGDRRKFLLAARSLPQPSPIEPELPSSALWSANMSQSTALTTGRVGALLCAWGMLGITLMITLAAVAVLARGRDAGLQMFFFKSSGLLSAVTTLSLVSMAAGCVCTGLLWFRWRDDQSLNVPTAIVSWAMGFFFLVALAVPGSRAEILSLPAIGWQAVLMIAVKRKSDWHMHEQAVLWNRIAIFAVIGAWLAWFILVEITTPSYQDPMDQLAIRLGIVFLLSTIATVAISFSFFHFARHIQSLRHSPT